jgi:hypothetical protein
MVVFGGDDGVYRSDVMALALSSPAWSALAPSGSSPSGRFAHTASYDPTRDRMLVFGGFFNAGPSNNVWALSWYEPVNDVVAGDRPSRSFLHAVRPNPVHSSAEIRFEIPSERRIVLDVLDIQGRLMRNLRNGFHAAGSHSVVFDRRDGTGRTLRAGMYLIRLRSGDDSRTTRIMVLP